MTGAAPLSTSMRSTSLRFSVGIAGLKAPPHGTASMTSRNASNSCNPQKEGTALEGPASPPAGASTPDTRLRAEAMSWASRARSSSPETTEMVAGICSIGSGMRVAVTVTTLSCPSVGVMEGPSAACIPRVAMTRRPQTIHRRPRQCPINSPVPDSCMTPLSRGPFTREQSLLPAIGVKRADPRH